MVRIKRILGKRGRTTIPYEFRKILDLRHNDVLTFAMNDAENGVVITKERICTDDCIFLHPTGKDISLDDFLSKMNREELVKAIAALSKALVEKEADHETQDISD